MTGEYRSIGDLKGPAAVINESGPHGMPVVSTGGLRVMLMPDEETVVHLEKFDIHVVARPKEEAVSPSDATQLPADSFICDECGVWVHNDAAEQHALWHEQLAARSAQ